MENIYLNSTKLSWRIFTKYFIIAIILGISFIFMEVFDIIQIDSEILYGGVLSVLSIFIFIQAMNPKLNKCIVDELGFRSESLAVIIIPIITAAITRIFINILQVIPILFGGNVIGIAKGQLNMSRFSPIERILTGTIVGPFAEEFIFRVVFFTTIAYILGWIDDKFGYKLSKQIFNFRSILCWGVIIIGNILFSLSHIPDVNNFHLYFIGGVIDTIIYIKYGFYASWLSHGFYNLFKFPFIFSWFGIN